MERPALAVNVVSGPLGAGKTTAILAALRARPEGERWAVLVNEFGSVGIDGPILSSEGGVEVREIAGGCVCCVAGPMLRAALVRLVREIRPDRLLVEPSGLAHPAAILDQLRSPGLREAVDLRATLMLLHPRRLRSADPELLDRLPVADVVVGTHADLLGEDELAAFRERAAACWPRPLAVVTTESDALDPSLLDLRPAPRTLLRVPHEAHPHVERGWIWPPEQVFDLDRLLEAAQTLVHPTSGHAERVKGLFRTARGWRLLQATPDTVRVTPSGWRRDSRVEVIARPGADWDAIEAAWTASLEDPAGGMDAIEV